MMHLSLYHSLLKTASKKKWIVKLRCYCKPLYQMFLFFCRSHKNTFSEASKEPIDVKYCILFHFYLLYKSKGKLSSNANMFICWFVMCRLSRKVQDSYCSVQNVQDKRAFVQRRADVLNIF